MSLTNDKKDEIVNIASEIANKFFVKIMKPPQVIAKIVAAFLGALFWTTVLQKQEANKKSSLKIQNLIMSLMRQILDGVPGKMKGTQG